MAATDIRPKITLACQECKSRNYITRKNRRNDPDRLDGPAADADRPPAAVQRGGRSTGGG